MALKTMSPTIKVIRQLISEVRKISSDKNMKDSLVAQYALAQSRKYSITDQQLCKAKEEMKYLANLYVCYLKSQRNYEAINAVYKGRGERTVKETATMVGFKLPHDPK